MVWALNISLKCLLNINLVGMFDLQELVVPRAETQQGESCIWPWNHLPMDIRSDPTVNCFKKKLKKNSLISHCLQ